MKTTTIRLFEEIHRAVKQAALDSDQSLNAWITQAIQEKIEQEDAMSEPYSLAELEKGIGLYTDRHTKIAQRPDGSFVTCEINDVLGSNLELVGFADPAGEITWV